MLVREDCQKALPPEAADKAFLLDARLFDKLAQTVTSQGILAVVAKAEVRKEDFIGLPGSNFIVLDRLQDPGNIGTILRTGGRGGLSAGDPDEGDGRCLCPESGKGGDRFTL